MINGHQLNIKTTIDDRNREINFQYIYINDKWTMFNSKTVTTTRGYPCCGVFRCAPGEDDLKSWPMIIFLWRHPRFFFEGTLTNDNWDITIDIPEISNLNGNVSQIFQGVFADGSKPFKTYQSLRVEGMNIQRYTSYSGVKTRVIAYLKCRSLVCSSHIDFRLCRQNNHISMYNTYI